MKLSTLGGIVCAILATVCAFTGHTVENAIYLVGMWLCWKE